MKNAVLITIDTSYDHTKCKETSKLLFSHMDEDSPQFAGHLCRLIVRCMENTPDLINAAGLDDYLKAYGYNREKFCNAMDKIVKGLRELQ